MWLILTHCSGKVYLNLDLKSSKKLKLKKSECVFLQPIHLPQPINLWVSLFTNCTPLMFNKDLIETLTFSRFIKMKYILQLDFFRRHPCSNSAGDPWTDTLLNCSWTCMNVTLWQTWTGTKKIGPGLQPQRPTLIL